MDRNWYYICTCSQNLGRTPQECVDRNISTSVFSRVPSTVALHRSAWIEISGLSALYSTAFVALHRSAWIEIFSLLLPVQPQNVALHRSAWIEIKS